MTTKNAKQESGLDAERVKSVGWKEMYLKEDWWAIWLGVGIVVVAYLFFVSGSSIRWIAVHPARWHNFGQLGADFSKHIWQYVAQFIMWSIIFCVSLKAMGYKLKEFMPAFVFVYLVSVQEEVTI